MGAGRLEQICRGGCIPSPTFDSIYVFPPQPFHMEPPSEVRHGRWDKDTGTIVYDDERVTQSAVIGPALTDKQRRKARVVLTADKSAKEAKPKQEKPEGRTRFDPLTDPRRFTVIELYKTGMAMIDVAHHPDVRMKKEYVGLIIRTAGVKRQPSVKSKKMAARPRPKAPDPNQHPRRDEILAAYATGKTVRQLKTELGIGEHVLRNVLRAAGTLRNKGAHWRPDGSGYLPTWKLTPEIVQEIINSPETGKALAAKYGASESAVSAVRVKYRKSAAAD